MNILWLIGEDMGPQIGCYDYPLMRTPNLDRLAGEGAKFTRCFTTAPVCSPSRSAWNTGMYQTTIGAHHHRSHRKDGYTLPDGVKLISRRLHAAGYFTANVTGIEPGLQGTGKTDFNFSAGEPFDGTHWNQRRKDQPFFAQINFRETHKGPAFPEARKQQYLVDPKKVPLPPYYPDHPVVRDEFANYLDAMNLLDKKIGRVLQLLNEEGLAENTVVFFFGDNGRCLIRGKQWLYDAGIHIPLMVRWPGVTEAGRVRDDLVSAIDITATSLAIAGVPLPEKLQGQVMLGPSAARPRDHIYAARDRCDMTVDRIRCIRNKQYKLIRNFMPERPYTQFNAYIEKQYPTLGVMKKLYAEGKLNETQSLFMQPKKPEYELYDVTTDPHEVNNLAGTVKHKYVMKDLNGRLGKWIEDTDDQGRFPEKEAAQQL
ncbi:MAG: sulfatase family protein [Bryobacteraceae bacterium]